MIDAIIEQASVYDGSSPVPIQADVAIVGERIGLIGALELVRDKASKAPFDAAAGAGPLAAELSQQEGLILRAMGDSLALCPPLVITSAELDELFDILERGLERTQGELKQRGLL